MTSKTQPFPLKPPPLAKNTFRMEDMYDRSPEHARFCKELFARNHMKIGAPYTPLPLEGNALFFPSTLGGGNWGGVSVDPSLGLLFVNVMNIGQWGHMEKRGSEFVRTSVYGPYARFWDRETRVPCQNPPFGELIAVDLASGDIAWRSVLGTIEALEDIALLDARKGLNMFHQVEVPVLGIVENMSYFLCPHCGGRSEIFSHGGARREAEKLGTEFLGEVPLDLQIRETSDDGRPITVSDPDNPHSLVFRAIARRIWEKIAGSRRRRPRPAAHRRRIAAPA